MPEPPAGQGQGRREGGLIGILLIERDQLRISLSVLQPRCARVCVQKGA